MKTHTNNYKNEIKKFGRQIDSKITYTSGGQTIELGKEQLNSITPHYEGSILKSVMKQLDIDSNVEIPEGTILNYKFGVLVNNAYEYVDYGNYVVYDIEKQEDTRSWKITCYDKMLYSMKDYEAMEITYPITIKNYLSAVCDKIGLTLKNDYFINQDKIIQKELYLDSDGNSLDYTFRDVLDEIAGATGSTICINDDDELEVRYISNAGEQTTTLEGTNISIANAEDSKVKDLQLQGNTTQNGTPTPSTPQPINVVSGRQEVVVCGKNLFNNNKVILGRVWNGGVNTKRAYGYIEAIQGQQYTVSANNTNSDLTMYLVETSVIGQAGTAIRQQQITTEITFTPQTNTKYIAIQYATTNNDITQETIDNSKTMIAKGTDTTYEAYKGQTYEINLGKNLINPNNAYTGTSNGIETTYNENQSLSFSGTTTGTWFYLTNKININLPSGDYTFSIDKTVSSHTVIIRMFYNETQYQDITINKNTTSRTVNVSNNTIAYQVYCCGITSGTEVNDTLFFQLEKGSSASSFSPYKTPIELCKIGNYQDHIFKAKDGDSVYDNLSQETKDTLTYGSWYIEKQIGKVVLNGSENWTAGVYGTNSWDLENIIATTWNTNELQVMSSVFKGVAHKDRATSGNNIMYSIANKNIEIRNTTLTTKAQVQSATSGTPIYYVLSTPTYTEITDEELLTQINSIKLIEGLNNITISSSDLSSPLKITYVSGIDTIDEEYLKDVNVNFGEKFGKVNSIVLSRSAESDNVYIQDEASIEENGLCEIKIKDNQIMNGNNRDEFLPGLLEALDGLEYYINDFTSTGITYYDLCDKYFVSIDGKKYKCIMFNNEVDITQGLEEQVYTEMPEESETDYKKADSTDRRINQAYIIVDKQNQEIYSVASNYDALNKKLYGDENTTGDIVSLQTTMTQKVDSIDFDVYSAKVDDIETNGATKVQTTSVKIDNSGLNVSTDTSKISTQMTNNAFEIKDSGNTTLAYFGYDEEEGISKSVMDNLTVENYFIAGNHRVEDYTEDGENRTGWFYIGG